MALRVDDVDLVRDRALVERFQEGDPAAFDTLYTRYFGRLVRFCHKRVGDPHEAEEIAQEAFTKALRALPEFEGERRFYPWMTVIAGRLCVDAHRRRGRTEPSSSVDLGVIEGGQEKIIDLVDVEILRTAMAELAPRHREVLDLRELQGWSYQQIADHYGVTLGTVEALLFRARKALKREFMAVVGGDRNWAAVPVFGAVLRRVASWKARIEAMASTGVPALSGPGIAAAMFAVTAVTGAVSAGVLHHADGPSERTADTVRIVTPASASNAFVAPGPVSGPGRVDAPASGGASAGNSAAAPAASTRPTVEQAVAGAAASVEPTDSATSAEGAAAQPISVGVGPALHAGVDPGAAAAEIAEAIDNYRHDKTAEGQP